MVTSLAIPSARTVAVAGAREAARSVSRKRALQGGGVRCGGMSRARSGHEVNDGSGCSGAVRWNA